MTSPPGLDLDGLARWMADQVPDAGAPLSGEVLTGGRSNLTYRVSDGTRQWVVRRPPLGHVLATAHDMAREYRVMTALAGTAVPVPRTWAICDDPAVVGAPFYVMDLVPGAAYSRATELRALGPERTRTVSEHLVDTLAGLHLVDPASVGLADFGRPTGYVARQVRRWRIQLDASRSRELTGADELHAQLSASIPPEAPGAILHGDFKLDNVLVVDDCPAAVLDWEMATLGDPLTDLALLLLYHRLGVLVSDVVSDVALAPGFLGEDETVERYVRMTGREPSYLPFHLGLAAYKLAVILEGIHYRHLQGQTVGDGFATVGAVVEPLLAIGLSAIKESS